MRTRAFIPAALTVAVALSACLLVPAAAVAQTTTCSAPPLYQPFVAFGDTNFYSPVVGASFDNFSASGWTLSGGAKSVATAQADGTRGSSLELPAKAVAVGPATCINNSYPYARTIARGLGGAVKVTVSYATASGWTAAAPAGEIKTSSSSWQSPGRLTLTGGPESGWRLAKFTFTSTGLGTPQLYNFFVDPRMR